MSEPCKYEADIVLMKTQCALIPEIHSAIVGKTNGTPGMQGEIRDLKAWRSSTTTRIKTRAAMLWAVIGSVIGGAALIIIRSIVGG